MISENTVAEQRILTHKDAADGCDDYFSLQEFYEGVVSNTKAVLTSKKDIQELFYGGENPPHMWWDRFEVKLSNNFAVIDKYAGRQVHSDVMKLRIINSKVRADFLVAMNMNIKMQMNAQHMVMTYTHALSNYRNIVNQRHPIANNTNNTRSRIQNLADCGGKVRGKAGYNGSNNRSGNRFVSYQISNISG